MDDDRPHDPKPLEIETRDANGGQVLRLSGELDYASCEALELALQRAEESVPSSILIDIQEVEFIDSTGLRTLLSMKRRADRSAYELSLTRGTGYVADMFRLTALDQTLPFTDE